MNNKIARKLNQCRHEADPKRAANIVASEITDTHNAAVGNGSLATALPSSWYSKSKT